MGNQGNEHERQQRLGIDRPIAASIRAGDTIYLAGQVAEDAEGRIRGLGDVVEQAEVIFGRIRDVLAAEGAELTDVVKLVTYFAVPLDEELALQYWEVRRRFFGDHTMASTGIQVAALIHPECLIEIEATAHLPS